MDLFAVVVRVCLRECVRTRVRACVRACARARVCVRVCMHVCVYVWVCLRVRVHGTNAACCDLLIIVSRIENNVLTHNF